MKRLHSLRTRAISLLLSLVCIIGVFPTTAFAAGSEITLKDVDFDCGTGQIGLSNFKSPGLDDPVLLHLFTFDVDGAETYAFCTDHSAHLGEKNKGHKWNNPHEISVPRATPVLAYYYWSIEQGKFSALDNQSTNGYVQTAIWMELAGKLPDWQTNEEAWITALAKERDAVRKAYGWGVDPDWTSERHLRMVITEFKNGTYGGTNWSFTEWNYAGSLSGKQQTVLTPYHDGDDTGENDEFKLIIKKVDATNPTKGLPGAMFKVEGANNFSKTYTTGSDGTIVLTQDNLDPGTYGVTEVAAPSGYEIDDSSIHYVSLGPGQEKEITMTWYDTPVKTGSGSIRKVDSDNPSLGLAGAVIKITGVDNNFTGTYVTGDGGYIPEDQLNFKDMPIGSYVAEEVTPPSGYIMSPDAQKVRQEFYWDGQHDVKLVFENDSKVKLQLIKKDASGKTLSGAVFDIYKDGQIIGSEATNGSGIITVSNITEGFYYFKERVAPEGYALMDHPVGAEVDAATIQRGGTVTVTAVNYNKPTLTIIKKDMGTAQAVKDCTFKIEGIDVSFVAERTTDANGKIYIQDLEPGSYKVTEIHVPDNYILNSEPQTIYLGPGANGELEFFNSHKPGLKIQKVNTSGEPIAGVKFNVKVKDGSSIGDYTTDANGEIFIPDLEATWYTVTETYVPDPYILDSTPHDVLLEVDEHGEASQVLRLENLKKPDLLIKKLDSIVHGPVANAKFRIWFAGNEKPGSSQVGTLEDLGLFTTDENGEILLKSQKVGWYQVQEVEPPDGYQLKEPSIQSIYLAGDDVKTLTFENTPLSAIVVLKKDSVNGNPVPGCTFQLRYLGGTSGTEGTTIGEKTTGTNGSVIWTRLKAGTYIVEEISAADGYNIVTAAKTVYISGEEQDVITVTFENAPDGNLLIRKVCSVNPSVTLSKAEFKVTYADGTLIGDSNGLYTTDANGTILISGLEPGKSVVVTETRAPDGFIIDTKPQTIVIQSGKTVTLTFQNQPKGELIIEKRDSVTNQVLPGAEFRVTTAAGCEVGLDGVIGTSTLTQNGIFTTDALGQIHLTNLQPGAYIITEIKAPDGYVIDSPMTNVVIGTNGDTQTVIIKDTPESTLVIEKRDSVTKEPLADAVFKVTTSAGTVVDNAGGAVSSNGVYKTDAEGRIVLTNLQPDTYIVSEIQAPAGYLMDAPNQTVKINKGDTRTLTFYDTPRSSLIIEKRDSVTKEPLAGATFKITNNAGTALDNYNGTISSGGLYTTDANGQIKLYGIDPDSYIVTEVEAPDGYLMDAPSQAVRVNVNDTQTLTFFDTPMSSLIIEKRDKVTREPLANATFRVTTSDGAVVDNYYGTVSSNGLYTTDSTGIIRIYGLKPDTYVVTEVEAPDGYLMDAPSQTVKVNANDTQTLTFYDSPEGGLIIEKRDVQTNEPLYGATFKVMTSSGEFVAQGGGTTSSNGLYTTDRNGQIHIYGLEPDTYVVTEVEAPDGYMMDAPSQTVKVNANDTQTLTFYDTPIGGLIITKVDEANGKRLEGAKFEIRKQNGEIIGTYTTNQQGNIELTELDSGWYEVVELKAPSGYLLDTNPHRVEVKDGEQAKLEIENTASASMLIHKIDSVSKKGIQGVKFVLYDSSMTPIGEYESDDQGYVHLNKTLEDGKYYVREIVAAEGYILDNNTKSFYVTSGDTTMITWENTPQQAQIQIVKTSADYNTTNGLPAGTPLEGAVFAIYDKRNNVVDTIKTNSSGIASSKLLPNGTYTVKEITAPANYGLNPNTFTADLEFAGQVYKIEVTDPSISTGLTIKKTGYQQVMNGQSVRYTVSNVANTSSVNLNSFYWRDTIPTDAVRLTRLVTGTYSYTQNYKVTYTTNLDSSWQTAYDNLSTAKNYTLDMSASALGLASNEYVTSFMLSFGVVPAGFHQLTNAYVDATVKTTLANGYQFTNKADVGGLYGTAWLQNIARWTTSVYSTYVPPKPTTLLPRTGY